MPYTIYLYDQKTDAPYLDWGVVAHIADALDELDALKKWYKHLNGMYSPQNYLRSTSIYSAVCGLANFK